MGLLFVILFHFAAIFILSLIIGVIAVIISYFKAKNKRKRKLFFAFTSPFIGFYACYVSAFFGSLIISEIKGVDTGVGDEWFVQISDNYVLSFIDIPDYGSIYYSDGGEAFVSDIAEIEQQDNLIFGKTTSENYFSFNLENQELKEYDNLKNLILSNGNKKLHFKKAYDFYIERRNEISGVWNYLIGISSLLFSAFLLVMYYKILLFNFKFFNKK